MADTEWIAVDWGTSHLRAWAIGPGDKVIRLWRSDQGMGGLTPDAFGPALSKLLADLPGTGPLPIIACGMVGARQGWAEAPYATAPCAPPSIGRATRIDHDRFRVAILPGIKQHKPADVMRGEETQIAGFLSERPGFDGIVCLPGTHTKWVQVSAGEVVFFRTFMTGELYGLLAGQSVLRHSVDRDGWDDAAFADAVSDALSRPADLGARLFGIRALGLLQGIDPAAANARLSGLLIGLELAGARSFWLGREVAVIGAGALVRTYTAALGLQGVEAQTVDGEIATLRGLAAAHSDQERST